jgi:hypothetical protein
VKRATDKILAALRVADPEKLSSVELQKRSGVTIGFYPWLAALEDRGFVRSEFHDGPYLRARLYGIGSAERPADKGAPIAFPAVNSRQ